MRLLQKLISVAIVVMVVTSAGFAQEAAKEPLQDNKPLKVKVKREKLPGIDYRHEFRLGVGTGARPIYNAFMPVMGGPRTPVVLSVPAPIYSAYYGYRIVAGLKVTANFSFGYDYRSSDNPTINHTYSNNSYFYRISPSIQYEWFNRGLVTMYSEVGCTFAFETYSSTTNGVHSEGRVDNGPNAVLFDVTPIGITVGKKLFGFAELLSFGPRGFINVGIGYRFK